MMHSRLFKRKNTVCALKMRSTRQGREGTATGRDAQGPGSPTSASEVAPGHQSGNRIREAKSSSCIEERMETDRRVFMGASFWEDGVDSRLESGWDGIGISHDHKSPTWPSNSLTGPRTQARSGSRPLSDAACIRGLG